MTPEGKLHAGSAARLLRALSESHRQSERATEDHVRLVTQTLKLCFAVVERAEVPRDVAARAALRTVAEVARGAMNQADFIAEAELAAVVHLDEGRRSSRARVLLLRAYAEWALADKVDEAEVRAEAERELAESLYGEFPRAREEGR